MHPVRIAEQGYSTQQAKCKKYIARHHDAYWLSYDIDTKIKHATLLSSVEDSGFQIEVTEDKKHEILELNFTCPDHPGLFSRLSGACAVAGLTIVDAKLAITKDGMALDVLRLQENTAVSHVSYPVHSLISFIFKRSSTNKIGDGQIS